MNSVGIAMLIKWGGDILGNKKTKGIMGVKKFPI